MKNNEELKHRKNTKIPKKNFFLMISLITIGLILLLSLAYYFLIYKNDSNTLKRYLINNNYYCNKKVCYKKENNFYYEYDYVSQDLKISNKEYILKLTKKTPVLEIKSENYLCLYEKDDYQDGQSIDETFEFNNYCKKYISEINEHIVTRNNINKQVNKKTN